MSWVENRPLRIILHWQLVVTIVIAIAVGLLFDLQSAISAFLGGSVSFVSSAAFALIVSRHKGYSASGTIRTALRAEAVKIILIIMMLWLVFRFYEEVNAFAFIGTFVITVIVHSMALFVSDHTKNKIND
ncbi:MAG: ATP synthase subunit I [Betaproteobacteria bacterium]|nr:ATP synthase subunit I [Betaproteobacteria bacterium]